MLERRDAFIVIECEQVREPLVKILLRLGVFRSDRMIDASEAILEPHCFFLGCCERSVTVLRVTKGN